MNHVAIADIPSPEIFTQDVRSDGSVQWLRNGFPHRLNGPAMIEADGTLVYMEYGLEHRLNGPAVVRLDGTSDYYLQGKRLSQDEFEKVTGVKTAHASEEKGPPGGIGSGLRPLPVPVECAQERVLVH